jgi:uncharacterized protein
MYARGEGLAKDLAKAADFYPKGCDLQSAESCLAFADMLRAGEGAKKDLGKAIQLYDKACAGGAGAG